jgi:predicted nucleic acid-binding protein
LTIGVDTNILCYALDPAYPEHKTLSNLLIDLSPENTIAINPTVLHETYHVLVFYSEWLPKEAANRLSLLLKHPYIEFHNQTKKTSQIALNLAAQHNIGGRDALIIANYLTNKIPTILTHDNELLTLKKISWKNFHVTFKDPLKKN